MLYMQFKLIESIHDLFQSIIMYLPFLGIAALACIY